MLPVRELGKEVNHDDSIARPLRTGSVEEIKKS